VLVGTAAVTTTCVFPSFLLGAMAVQVRRDLGFSELGIGLGFGAFFLAASLSSVVLGRVAERAGPVRSLRVAAVVSGTACLAVAVAARDLPTLILLLAVAGTANALCQPAANLLIARELPAHRQGLGFAVKQSAIPTATLLAGAAVPALALTVGWRWAFVAAAGLSVATALTVPPVVSPPLASRAAPGGRGVDVPVRVLAVLSIGIGFGAASGGTLGSFLVSGAVDAGISEGGAGLLLTAGSLVGITVRLGAGVQADRRDGRHLVVVTRMLLGGAVAYALLATESVAGYLVAGPLGFATGWAFPGLFNLAIVRANPARPAAATGITQTGTYFGAVAGPLLFGAIAEASSYRVAWSVAAAFALVGAAAIVAGRRCLIAWKAAQPPATEPVTDPLPSV
jgi:MFS family permease